MAEKFLQNKLYEYKANSNLVLESERDFRTKRGDEGTGEVESLKSKVHGLKMGDRVHDFNSVNDAPSKKRKLEESIAAPTSKRDKLGNLEKVLYIPKSAECRQAYEEMLTILRKCIGDISHDMLKGAATEVLEILKDANKSATVQRAELKIMSGDLDEEKFRLLLSLSKRITDYNVHMESVLSDAPLEEGMAVVFDDEDDENVDELIDDDENDVENTISGHDNGLMKKLKSSQIGDDVEDQMDELSAHDIDAYWLQRQLSKYYNDPNASAKLADEVLSTLHSTDERICENNLVMLLDFDKFSLIKYFLKHRHKIYYCIKLKQAQSEEDRQSIEAEMKNDLKDGGFQIWSELNERTLAESWAKDRMGLMADRARREAQEIAKLGKYEEVENPLQNQGVSGSNIDLDSLIFKDGGHFMANTRCELPEKSWRAQKKGYEEVHVPAFKPIVNPDEKLVQVSSLPDWMHSVFEGVRTFNRVQSKMCTAALDGDHNLLLCAPTGSGKTNVALLCMLGIIAQHRNNLGDINFPDFKIVYIAPMKALVQECVQNFAKRLSSLNISVRELSGDQSLTSRELADTNVIVTTPEKWDVVTRKSMDRSFTQLVKLIIIDEIHLLHDDRGAVLEGLVARTLRQCEIDESAVRLVGLSATLPNYEDVATFLRVNSNGLFFFDSSYRPVPLQQQFIGITEKKVLKKVQTMNEICYEKVLLHAGKNQVLIFTHSRADTVKTAKALRDLATTNDTLAKFVKEDSASSEILRAESANAKSAELKDLLPYGFAVHHAGLQRSDRSLVEDLFADRHIQVLISTATLAWGVNLPCHTVIIKGTQIYSPEKGAWTELSPLDVLQMIGRAGRYGLDSEGEGIIITNHSELQYYLSLLNNQLPIESQLVKRLPDLLNAEIVSQSIGTLEEAAEWLGYTYMYIRMLKNPQLYGIDSAQFSSDLTLFKWRKRLAMSALTRLEKNDLIKFDRKSGVITSTYLGRISSHYYITNETIAAFKTNMRPTMSEIDILRLFALSSEFKFLYVKEEEKMELGKLLGRVPIPIKESFEEAVAKINVLLQAFISRMRLEVRYTLLVMAIHNFIP
jgi:pre-mRNA-splicing helicase BRR2